MKSSLIHKTTVAVASAIPPDPMFRSFAEMVSGRSFSTICRVAPGRLNGRDAEARLRNVFASEHADLMICEWRQASDEIQWMLRLAHELRKPAVLIRPGALSAAGRIVVATAGGPNVSGQIWIAKTISDRLRVPVEVLHWRPAFSRTAGLEDSAVEKVLLGSLGMQVRVHQIAGSDFSDGVNRILQDGDVLVMGAPGALRWGTSFEGSHPDRIAKRMSQPLILLSSAPSGAASLRRLFWGDLILPQAQASGREEAVELLIDCLIRHNQLSPSDKDRIFRAALERENISSTAVDCDTAFPHVLLPGFFGVSACMGIFPEGVKFGAGDGSLSYFMFLLITSKGFSEEYLKVLAKIAKRMICADVRFALLNCRTSQEVLQVLEPDIKQH